MRIAALAFGVLAGLVASLILALGGLDAGVLQQGSGDRQVSLIRFGLFVIGNFGVFGAALVLAAPLAGAIVLSLGAAAWIGAAMLLHHGPDPVLVTPPSLLVLAAIIAIVAHFRAPPPPSLAAIGDNEDMPEVQSASLRTRQPDPEPADFDSMPPVPVTAGFFGAGRSPAAVESEPERPRDPALRGLDQNDQIRGSLADNWDPRKKKRPPPRQQPMFRQAEGEDDDDEDESFFARFARGAPSVLSFGLYAALAGAAFLVFWNLRTGEARLPSVATAELPIASSAAPAADASSSEPVRVVGAPVLPEAAAGPVLSDSAEPVSPIPPSSAELTTGGSGDAGAGPLTAPARVAGLVVTSDPLTSDTASVSSEAPERLSPQAGLPLAEDTVSAASSEPPSQQETVEFPSNATTADSGAPPQPFSMTPAMAAARARPSPQPPARQEGTTGL